MRCRAPRLNVYAASLQKPYHPCSHVLVNLAHGRTAPCHVRAVSDLPYNTAKASRNGLLYEWYLCSTDLCRILYSSPARRLTTMLQIPGKDAWIEGYRG